jgi:Tol biopolymer transport system component
MAMNGNWSCMRIPILPSVVIGCSTRMMTNILSVPVSTPAMPRFLAAQVLSTLVGYQPSTFWAALTAAPNGLLIYNTSAGPTLSLLTWMDRTGKQLGRIGQPAIQCNPTLSPDGTRVAVDISDPKANNVDVWVESAAGTGNSRFTFDPAEDVAGVRSRDGKTVVYRSAGGSTGAAALVLKPANGLERENKIFAYPGGDDTIPNSWSPDDQQILLTHQSSSGYRLELLPRTAGAKPVGFQTGHGNQVSGMISPDGKWVAYASDESGTWEIYVTTFPSAVGKWQVSRAGGTEPRWRGDRKEIFYLGAGGMLTAAPVNTEAGFSTGTPVSLFQFHGRAAISSTDVFSYDVSKDGKKFLVNRYVKPDQITPLTIVLNARANPDTGIAP